MDPEREERANDGCARLIDPRTVTTSSRGRVRVVRSPLNVMARLAKVVRGNGTRGDRDHLFTGEGEGGEEPLERDGTTRQSRGKKWHVDEV
ncbi:hypothetical protein CDL15_Pgr010100 [Punica granatum]|uniref:Uncharacterized protein n=1 Tax=Punica granatum TaxID=22663 RepID=A0A218WY90_PUNGR|nr:hypothetical protein CDL15_Pgr010100 [Punica granatum]